jgi:hypothetical protein
MSYTAPFKCPCCSANDGLLLASTKPKSYGDLVGSACNSCGHVVSDDDIKGFATEIAAKMVRDALKGIKF